MSTINVCGIDGILTSAVDSCVRFELTWSDVTKGLPPKRCRCLAVNSRYYGDQIFDVIWHPATRVFISHNIAERVSIPVDATHYIVIPKVPS